MNTETRDPPSGDYEKNLITYFNTTIEHPITLSQNAP
jgi:hypothetical protein